MNYDLTHYDGNKNVHYAGKPPPPEVALAGFPPAPGEFWRAEKAVPALLAKYRAAYAERKAWNDEVEARKAAKKGSK
jgi:hypothetical protein